MEHALVNGIDAHIEADAAEALAALDSPLAVIEGPLMRGMNTRSYHSAPRERTSVRRLTSPAISGMPR